MAKNKKRRGKQSLFSKAINAGLIALGFSRVLEILFSSQSFNAKLSQIQRDATFGLSEGSFKLEAGLRMYTPAGAALALGALKSHLMKKFPVR